MNSDPVLKAMINVIQFWSFCSAHFTVFPAATPSSAHWRFISKSGHKKNVNMWCSYNPGEHTIHHALPNSSVTVDEAEIYSTSMGAPLIIQYY